MKKNNFTTDDDINLSDLIRVLSKEKILILFISIIFGLLGYLYGSFQPQFLKTEIKLKNPPIQLFEPYNYIIEKSKSPYICYNPNNPNNSNNPNNPNNSNNPNNLASCITAQFISDFKSNFLSLDNLESFAEEKKKEFDNFQRYLKSKNITFKQYFTDNKFGEVKEKNIVISNKYYLVFTKELDGNILFNNYVEFIKKKTVFELKKNLKLSIEIKIIDYQRALEKAKVLDLENPILISRKAGNQTVEEPVSLFYLGNKVLSQNIIHLKKMALQLENDQFNYNPILDKASQPKTISKSNINFVFYGIFLGIFFSILVIFLRHVLQNKN
jgi:LPS O-antigen subunit length determinant protein (WzzB/FepE family)